MRKRSIYIIAGVVVVIVCLAGLVYMAYTSTQAQRRTVYTVNTRIEEGTILTEPMLTTMEVPAPGKDDPFPYFAQKDGIVGRTALVTLLPNAAITMDAIGDPAPPGRLLPSGQVIPPGQVGFAIPTEALRSVGGSLEIGDTVSVLVPKEEESPVPSSEQPITYTVLYENVLVVDLRDEAGASLVTGEAQGVAKYVVLALHPDQTEEIAKHQEDLVLALEAH